MGYLSRVASRVCAPPGEPSGASIAPAVASYSPLAQRDQLLNLAEFAVPSSQLEPIVPAAPIAARRPMSDAAESVALRPLDARFPRRESGLSEQPWGGPSPVRLEPSAPSVSFARQSPSPAESVVQPDASPARERMAAAEPGFLQSASATPRTTTPASNDEPPERPSPIDLERHARTARPAPNERATLRREDAAARLEKAVAAARAWVSSAEIPLADHRKPLAPIVPAAAGRRREPDPGLTDPSGLHIGVLKVEVVPPPAMPPKRERRAVQRSRPAPPPAFPRGAAIYGWRQR